MVRPDAESDVAADVVEGRVEAMTDPDPTDQVNTQLGNEEGRGEAVCWDLESASHSLEMLEILRPWLVTSPIQKDLKPSPASCVARALAVITSPARSGRRRRSATEGSRT